MKITNPLDEPAWTTSPPKVAGQYRAAFADGSGSIWIDHPECWSRYNHSDFSHYVGPVPLVQIGTDK